MDHRFGTVAALSSPQQESLSPLAIRYTRETDNNRIIILKDRGSLESYFQVLRNTRVRNLLEFGILEGGSAVLFTLLMDLEKYVGIDIKDSARGIEPGWRVPL